MAKKRIPEQTQKGNRKVTVSTTHVPLCGLGAVLQEKDFFEPLHQMVDIPQKTVEYRPTDKLVFAAVGIVAGAETLYEINSHLRPNKPLLCAFGYEKCADQSVIQDTINAATEANVAQFEAAGKEIWNQNNRIHLLWPCQPKDKPLTVDIDLSPLPASKSAEGSKKGYGAKRKNQYSRQLARVLVPKTSEIVAQSLYPGNTLSLSVFKEMVLKMEHALEIATKEQRQQIRLRIDAGFGTDSNLNYALWRDYKVLAKMFSGNRAKVLAKSVKEWEKVPSSADNTEREAGWVEQPHRYCRKTVQVAVRAKTKKGGYSYSVLVTTRLDAGLADIVQDYDKRCGIPENTFCQDYQGLCVRKRRKGGFVAQEMLVLVSQLAHNLIVWTKSWMLDALIESLLMGEETPKQKETESILLAQKTIEERGIKRLVRQTLSLDGKVVFSGRKVVSISLNPLYPLIGRIKTAWEAFLKPYEIRVSLAKIQKVS